MGRIVTSKLESYAYQDNSEDAFVSLAGKPIMKFSCGTGEPTFELSGSVSGEVSKSDLNKMVTTSEASFGQGLGEENLKVITPQGTEADAKLTETTPMAINYPESMELYVAPPEEGEGARARAVGRKY